MKRRQLLIGLGVSTLATPLLVRRGNAQTEDENKHEVEYLFVQFASEANLANGVLTLEGINPSTLYFSDRPDRIVGHVTTKKFIDHWAKGKDNFEADPPNATLTILAQGRPEEVVVELKNPRLKRQRTGLRRHGPGWAENGRGRPVLAVHRYDRPAIVAAVDRRRAPAHASAHPSAS